MNKAIEKEKMVEELNMKLFLKNIDKIEYYLFINFKNSIDINFDLK